MSSELAPDIFRRKIPLSCIGLFHKHYILYICYADCMTTPASVKKTSPLLVQLIISFVFPTIVLMGLSDTSRLGPIPAMCVALAFPVGFEIYRLLQRKRPSVISILAIVGILFVGAVAVLKLSEEWLAVRRAVPYAAAAIAVFVIVRWKPALIEKGLDRLLAMDTVRNAKLSTDAEVQLMRVTRRAGYALAIVCAVIAVAIYMLTILFMSAQAGTSEFNAQYAELRIITIGAITVPFVILITIILVVLVNSIEKITGISAEDLLKKK